MSAVTGRVPPGDEAEPLQRWTRIEAALEADGRVANVSTCELESSRST